MTWKVADEPCRYGRPSVRLLREIASEVYQETRYKDQIKRRQIELGLACTTRLSDRARLKWWNPAS